MVQYREQLMPLVQMDGVEVRTQGSQPILVFADERPFDGAGGGRDHRHRRGAAQHRGRRSRDGILGSAVIKGLATEVIDVGHFLPMAFADWFSHARR